MADYFPGMMTIGGKVPAAVLKKFLKQITSTHASLGEYSGPAFTCATAEQLLRALDEKGHLVLADVEARFGMFEDLEAFCVEHGIPFDRHSDARHEFDAENAMFRPGMKSPLVVPSNNAGDDLFNAEAIRPVAKELARLLTAKLTKEKLRAAAVKVIRHLHSLLPPEVEPLPPLQVVAEDTNDEKDTSCD